jgi:hypothetical protein
MRRLPVIRTGRARTMAALLAIAAAWLARDGRADDRAPAQTPGDSLATPFALRGTVHDPAHTPLEGSVVEVFGSPDTSVGQARSDSTGAFDLPPLPGGSYRIVVSHSGFMTSAVAVDLGPTTGPLDLILEVAAAAQVPAVQEVQVRGDRGAGPGQTGTSVSVLSRKDVQALPGGGHVRAGRSAAHPR